MPYAHYVHREAPGFAPARERRPCVHTPCLSLSRPRLRIRPRSFSLTLILSLSLVCVCVCVLPAGGPSHLTGGCVSKGGQGAYAVAATKPISECNNRQWLGKNPTPLRPARRLPVPVGREHFLSGLQLPQPDYVPPAANIGGGNGFIDALTAPVPRIQGNLRNTTGNSNTTTTPAAALMPATPLKTSRTASGVFSLSGWRDSLVPRGGCMVGDGQEWHGHTTSAPLARHGNGAHKSAFTAPQLWGTGCANNVSQWSTGIISTGRPTLPKVRARVHVRASPCPFDRKRCALPLQCGPSAAESRVCSCCCLRYLLLSQHSPPVLCTIRMCMSAICTAEQRWPFHGNTLDANPPHAQLVAFRAATD